MMAYVWETGRPQNASIDWNRPWSADQQYALETTATGKSMQASTAEVKPAQGGTAADRGTITGGGEGRVETTDQADIALHKEELVVGKREVSNGGVIIRKTVQTENVSQPLDLRREEYTIERVPASEVRDAAAGSGDYLFKNREVYIALTREEPVASKRVLLTEKVHVGKKVETEKQTVSHQVRSEDIEIVKNPDLSDRRFSDIPRHPAPTWQGGTSTQSGVSTASASGQQEKLGEAVDLQVAREELAVGKREVDNGGVLLRKTVRSQDASQPVELRREEFAIDRTPVSDQVVENIDFRNREIRVDLTREEAVVGTRDLITEYIRVRKNAQTERQTIAGTVRRESLEIVKLTDSTGRPAAMLDREQPAQGGTSVASQSGVSTYNVSSAVKETGKDQGVSDRVKAALANGTVTTTSSASPASYSSIDVSTHNGAVTLRGTVNSEDEKKQLAKRVKEISGVRSVKNELQVASAH
jgi:uncharacterized protein (TIGR02271 family)